MEQSKLMWIRSIANVGFPVTIAFHIGTYISDIVTLGVVIALAFIVIVIDFVSRSRPINMAEAHDFEGVVNVILEGLISQYYKYLKSERPNNPEPNVRANLMLPTKNYLLRILPWNPYLKIYGKACTTRKTNYTTPEIRQPWHKGEGTCGWVWADKEEALYDSKDIRYQHAAGQLTEDQNEIVKHLNSVYSVPVWKDRNTFVGVLSLDSTLNITETLFDDDEIKKICHLYAARLGLICPDNGVLP